MKHIENKQETDLLISLAAGLYTILFFFFLDLAELNLVYGNVRVSKNHIVISHFQE